MQVNLNKPDNRCHHLLRACYHMEKHHLVQHLARFFSYHECADFLEFLGYDPFEPSDGDTNGQYGDLR